MATASYQVLPPDPLNFTKPEEWPKWIRRFERFRIVSGLQEKSEEIQVNTLIYSMGNEADDILRSFKLSEDHGKEYDVVKEKFEGFFVKRRNVIYERAKFNLRKQEEGETVVAFINDLYILVEHCQYGDLQDEMIRDRLVVGLRDAKLSEKLQLDSKLTLDTAVTSVRQSESVHRQQSDLRKEDEKRVPIDNIVKKGKPFSRGDFGGQKRGGPPKRIPQQSKCTRCGLSPSHDVKSCPAKDCVCRGCGKRGHYRRVCKSAKVSNIEKDTGENSDLFLGAVTETKSSQPWTVKISVNDKEIEFCLDTGAEVTAISERTHRLIGSPKLRPLDRELKGPNDHRLRSAGRFEGVLKSKNRTVKQEVYVVNNLHRPLLGRPAIEQLHILARINTVEQPGQSVVQTFSRLFTGLGKIDGEYTIRLKDGAKPFSLSTPRRVPIPLMKAVRNELDRMVGLGVISQIHEPTEWCAGMVPVRKKNGAVRICVDLTQLNQSVKRERHQLPAVEQVLAQLSGAKVFSKLDANSGFWQIPLAPESSALTTFITPFGRYQFHRLPFGITSAPEHFQRRMVDILSGTTGTVSMIDDVLVFGKNQEEHDRNLTHALRRIERAGLTLNSDKCEFSKSSISFLGQVINGSGIHPDPQKVAAIKKIPAPKTVSELRRVLGMTNQLSKFIPHLADKTKALRDLLHKNRQWVWDHTQQEALESIKESLTSTHTLALYDPNATTIVSADASSYGLGAVLLQEQRNGDIKPVAYISRSLSVAEERYAQIEKEALAFTWACEHFSDYLIGIEFCIHTDHKLLVPLFSTKNLEELPVRVQRFRIRMLRFHFSIIHVPGKDLVLADTLSRAPEGVPTDQDFILESDTSFFIDYVMESLPASECRLKEIQEEQRKDPICVKLVQYCNQEWPDRSHLSISLKPYYQFSSEISIVNGLLMRNSRIIIPAKLRADVLAQIHTGHQGLNKCRERARQSVWWPGLSKEIKNLVESCQTCRQNYTQKDEPLISSPFPELPWQKVGMDLFEFKKSTYLLVVDYYSRYIEIAKLKQLTAAEVILHSKSIFARQGIPEEVISDNGPQFSAEVFANFSRDYKFQHITSSPYHPRSNGEAERAVKTIKSLLKKGGDPYLALLAYRVTPLSNGYSPSQLLMGRVLRSTVPTTRYIRKPRLPDFDSLQGKEKQQRQKQKEYFDQHHGVKQLPQLEPGDTVWVSDRQERGAVEEQVGPRSYDVETPSGSYRRNRKNLISLPQPSLGSEQASIGNEETNILPSQPTLSTPPIRRSTRTTYPPDRYDPSPH